MIFGTFPNLSFLVPVQVKNEFPLSLAYPLEHSSEGKSLSHNQDICIRLLGQSEWLGGDVELSDQFNEQIII